MARKKVKLQWIANESTRRATYKKRMKGLMKKANELSILCGVDACVVVYGPYDRQPEAWPSPWQAACMMKEFRSKPSLDQCRKMVNQEGFTRQRISKARDQLLKLHNKNRAMEMEQLMYGCLQEQQQQQLLINNINMKDLQDLTSFVEDRLKMIHHRINNEFLITTTTPASSPTPPVQAHQPQPQLTSMMKKTPIEMAIEALERQVFTTTSGSSTSSTTDHNVAAAAAGTYYNSPMQYYPAGQDDHYSSSHNHNGKGGYSTGQDHPMLPAYDDLNSIWAINAFFP
ncbi:agamous-like MADS-box protein AGL80 [Malania oleifera]|uniref:agamous-like MADS-box protein AGL80 n=1 Tax=Malania oleifera TaxID=397392 RepID=UPI0025ADCFEB|nr:agamous-like MADS-box protein AGL80 [Malania oleifera]